MTGVEARLPVRAALAALALMFGSACDVGQGDRVERAVIARTRGLERLKRDELKLAEEEFRRVIELAPREALGYANLAVVLLRDGRLAEAETQASLALAFDSTDANVILTFATIRAARGDSAGARALLERSAARDASEPRVLYTLAGLAPDRRVALFERLLERKPTSVVARMGILEALVAAGSADSAAATLAELRRLPPEPPREAIAYYAPALRALRAGDLTGAAVPLTRFTRAMVLTKAYQEDLESLEGPKGPRVGQPVLRFSPDFIVAERARKIGQTIRDQAWFTDATAEGGARTAEGRHTIVADYDNDGTLDRFTLDTTDGSRRGLFADLDHDGDLDLLKVGAMGVRAERNNGDRTFTVATDAFGLSGAAGAGDVALDDVAIGDVDGDGRLDVLVAGPEVGLRLWRNVGARRFEEASRAVGLGAEPLAQSLVVQDFDNDGALDLFVAGEGKAALWRNRGDGIFRRDARAVSAWTSAPGLDVRDAEAMDFDNDGWLDIVLVGRPAGDSARGVVLLANDGDGRFVDRSALIPAAAHSGDAITIDDFDEDGDEDVLVLEPTGATRVLRNDGGNANLFVDVRLTGLRTGSGKNNAYGIGSRIELRAGDLVQTRTVTGPVTHIGLGPHLKADVLRIEWPNGVPQVIHFPGSDQDVLEREVLKSSCGFLYAWDGERFAFVTDVMWRSALGMPLGIMGSNTAWAPAGASQEYLRIPGSALRERDGAYLLQLTEELWETSYTDELKLIAVDHPDSVEIFVDERFVPPAPVSLRLHQAVQRRAPRSAVDEFGRDVLPALLEKDDVYLSDLVALEYQGLVEPHDLVLDLGPEAGGRGSTLFLRGWIYPTDASINVALSQQTRIVPMVPTLEVRDPSGAWRKVEEIGFPSGKDKTIVVDLEGRFPTPDHHVRIRTNMQIYWDEVFVAVDAIGATSVQTTLTLESADLHYRGTSYQYRKGGRFGPHWFDYDRVTTEPLWRPITGRYTRFGDVRELLGAADDMYIVMAPGDETTLRFTAPPPPPAGWTRDFLLYTDGWIKDADLNTALGNTVAPLPFHAIRSYPYAPGDAYPSDDEHQRYLREFNTREARRPSSRR